MPEFCKTKGIFFLTISTLFLVTFEAKRALGKSIIKEGKIEVDGKILDVGKLQYSSHPEVRRWQDVLRNRRKDRKDREKEDNITTKIVIGPHGNEIARKMVETDTHPPIAQNESKDRVKRLPILATLIPHISKFAGGFILPLLGELIHRPRQPNQYNQNIIKRFLPKVIKNTNLSTPRFKQEIQTSLKNSQYSKAMTYIEGAERELDHSHFELKGKLKQVDWVHADSFRIVNRTRILLNDLTQTLDNLFQTRLNTVSNVFATYLASLIQQLRITVLEKNDQSKDREVAMGKQIRDIQATLIDFTHKPELGILYIVNGLLACINLIILFALYSLKQYLGKMYLKNTLNHYRAFDDQTKQVESQKKEPLIKTKKRIVTLSESQL